MVKNIALVPHEMNKEEVISPLPNHVAIIMDGNGRWAKKRHAPKILGHRQGAESARETVKSCIEYGVPYLTLYAFSSENWNRGEAEVNDLMGLLRYYLKHELAELHKNGVKLCIIGDRSQLDAEIIAEIEKAETLTQDNKALTLTIALSYGSRQEITHAIRVIAKDAVAEKLEVSAIDEETINQYLFTHTLPEPDLLIRTSGEQRLSNFLLWQLAYAELYFTPTLWPDFGKAEFREALLAFSKRERRYGAV